MNNVILSALDAIPVAELTYKEWLYVGMAIEHEGYECSVWDDWSRNDARYKEGECQKKWRTFRGDSKPLTGGTIIRMARQRGWTFDAAGGCMGWNTPIVSDGAAPARLQKDTRNPADELINYLRALYKPKDIVAYCLDAQYDSDKDKWKPCSNGVFNRTRDELIAALEQHPNDIPAALGKINTAAGAWIRMNPVDGQGASDKNVASYRYALVESDDMPVAEQLEKLYEMRLPIKAVVFSGSRSVHAVVRVDAVNELEYRANTEYLFNYCDANGLQVDHNNSNPSRLSRMPGIVRGENYQQLVAMDIGCKSWDDWKYFAEHGDDDLPDFESLGSLDIDNPPQPPEELIKGILRCGHKMIVSAASKAGKSMLLMELCIAIAEGREWLGFQCKQGKVLYINLEIDPASAEKRIAEVYKELGISNEQKHGDNIIIWNLRGNALPLDQLAPKLIRRMCAQEFVAVVFDPIYKIITGDENNASEMGQFCNQFDKVCRETGAAAIYCHHHSKGAQGGKRAMDRASGSGVFARDPDAQLDIIELVLTEDMKNNLRDKPTDTAWRLESSLREFPNITPVNFWYSYPIHRVDGTGELSKALPEGHKYAGLNNSPTRKDSDADRRERLDSAFDMAFKNDKGQARLKELVEAIGVTEPTVRKWIDERFKGAYVVDSGLVTRVDTKENG